MSEVSIAALRQAFLDPESRIRLASDPKPEDHTELLAIAWQGGFLDGAAIHFNENLNALIGGRGTGKSTVIESIRYVLDARPLGEDAKRLHADFVKHVLRSGTKISLLVRSHRPAKREYLIERTVPNPATVRDIAGDVMKLTPAEVVPQAEVFGQHEISELTRHPEKLTLLLERFVQRNPTLQQRKTDVSRQLEESREEIVRISRDIQRIDEKLESLPGLEETLKRYEETGLQDKLKDRTLLVQEEAALKAAEAKLQPFREIVQSLENELPISTTELSDEELKDLPAVDGLKKARQVVEALSRDVTTAKDTIAKLIEKAETSLAAIRSDWAKRQKTVQQAYEKTLRELQKDKIDGQEFISTQEQIGGLRPLTTKKAELKKDLASVEEKRRNALAAWQDVTGEEFRELERAAKRVNKQLTSRVNVTVKFAGNRQQLEEHIRSLGGRLTETVAALASRESLSTLELAKACRNGRDSLIEDFVLPPNQADKLAAAEPDFIMQLEELDLPATTTIQLNVAAESSPPVWKPLADLSTGQKATAVLLLLLLESEGPLVVDQPEDDLDNRFITEGIVPKMREEKRRRQFVFATHNANIPVLGDAELIVGLTAAGEADSGRASIPKEHMGSIDSHTVCELVEEVLEGGKAAFELRRLKYGF